MDACLESLKRPLLSFPWAVLVRPCAGLAIGRSVLCVLSACAAGRALISGLQLSAPVQYFFEKSARFPRGGCFSSL